MGTFSHLNLVNLPPLSSLCHATCQVASKTSKLTSTRHKFHSTTFSMAISYFSNIFPRASSFKLSSRVFFAQICNALCILLKEELLNLSVQHTVGISTDATWICMSAFTYAKSEWPPTGLALSLSLCLSLSRSCQLVASGKWQLQLQIPIHKLYYRVPAAYLNKIFTLTSFCF